MLYKWCVIGFTEKNINLSVEKQKVQLVSHIWVKLVWRVCDLWFDVLRMEDESEPKDERGKWLCF